MGIKYAGIDIRVVPCASRVKMFDGSFQGGDDDCIWDKDEVIKYIGGASFKFWNIYNQ